MAIFHRDIRWANVVKSAKDRSRWILIDWDDAASPPTEDINLTISASSMHPTASTTSHALIGRTLIPFSSRNATEPWVSSEYDNVIRSTFGTFFARNTSYTSVSFWIRAWRSRPIYVFFTFVPQISIALSSLWIGKSNTTLRPTHNTKHTPYYWKKFRNSTWSNYRHNRNDEQAQID